MPFWGKYVRDSRAKGGRYGNGRDGAVTPQQRQKSKKPVGRSGVSVVGDGNALVDAVFNRDLQQLTLYKGDVGGDAASTPSPQDRAAGFRATVVGGNTLTAGLYGIKKYAGELTTAFYSIPKRATGYANIDAAGAITDVVVTSPGNVNVLTATAVVEAPPPGGTQATVSVLVLNGSGWSVDAVGVTAVGSGYVRAPAVTFSPPPTGDFARTAKGYAIVENGKVVAVEVTDPGAGYASAPTITFSDGAATAVAYMSYRPVTEVTVVDPGAGYLTPPEVFFVGPESAPFTPGVTTMPDGLGWGIGIAGDLSGATVLIVNDDRCGARRALVGTSDPVAADLAAEVVKGFEYTRIRVTGEHADAAGALRAWVPQDPDGDAHIDLVIQANTIPIAKTARFDGTDYVLAEPDEVKPLVNESKIGLVIGRTDNVLKILLWGPTRINSGAPFSFANDKIYWLIDGGDKSDDIEDAYPPSSTTVFVVTRLCKTFKNEIVFWCPEPCAVLRICDDKVMLIPAYEIPNP